MFVAGCFSTRTFSDESGFAETKDPRNVAKQHQLKFYGAIGTKQTMFFQLSWLTSTFRLEARKKQEARVAAAEAEALAVSGAASSGPLAKSQTFSLEQNTSLFSDQQNNSSRFTSGFVPNFAHGGGHGGSCGEEASFSGKQCGSRSCCQKRSATCRNLPKVEVEPVPVLAAAEQELSDGAGDGTEFRRQQLAAHAEEKKRQEEEKQRAKEEKKNKPPKDPKPKGRPRKGEEAEEKEDDKEKEKPKKRTKKPEVEDSPAPSRAKRQRKDQPAEKPVEKAPTKKEKELATKAAKAEKRKPKAYDFEMDKDLMNEVVGVIKKYEGQTYDKKAETVHRKTLGFQLVNFFCANFFPCMIFVSFICLMDSIKEICSLDQCPCLLDTW